MGWRVRARTEGDAAGQGEWRAVGVGSRGNVRTVILPAVTEVASQSVRKFCAMCAYIFTIRRDAPRTMPQ